MNFHTKLAAILGMVTLLSCSAYTQSSKDYSATVTIRDQDVIDVFSSRIAVVQYQNEKCLYDIRNGIIVERNIADASHEDGYLLTTSVRSKGRYTLYSKHLDVIRTWKADSSRLLSDGAVAVKSNGQWLVVSNDGKAVHTSKQAVVRSSPPYVVIDSSRVLINTKTGDMLMDSVMLFFRWGKGIVVGRDSGETTSYYWYRTVGNSSRLSLGTEIVWAAHNSIVFRDSNNSETVYDTSMTVLCQSSNWVLECSKFLRVEYSRSGRTWCFIDLMGSDTRCGYDGIWPDGEGTYLVRKGYKWGMLRYDGKVIIPITHEIFVGDGHNSISRWGSYNGDNVIKYYTSLDSVSYYYYDINGYSKLFK